MKHSITAATMVAALAIAPQAWAAPITYDIDPVHSGIVFFIDHLGFAKVIGTANEFSGEFVFDS